MKNVKLLNPISPVWREVMKDTEYNFATDAESPEAIIVRSADMHSYALEDSVLAVARSGAGVNNIPLDDYAERGVVVFNSPGANANAVKELVIAALLLSARDIIGGAIWSQNLKPNGSSVEQLVEKGKKAFAGPEIAGKTLGVIGLGAVGLLVANAGAALGMDVLGFDPYISVDNAWKLSRAVRHARDEAEVIENSDFITVHTPLNDETRGKFNAELISRMKRGAALLNFSRGELAVYEDVAAALKSGQLRRYVCDFPTEKLLGVENAICLPHIGASTPESEDNCVRMVARELNAYLTAGAITHSVNYPDADPGRLVTPRIVVLHQNVPNVVNSITALISAHNINIGNMLNKSRGRFAYTCLDLDDSPDESIISEIAKLPTVYRTRALRPE